jgi:hypothetical protein
MTELSPAEFEREVRKLRIWDQQIRNKTFICCECRGVCCACRYEIFTSGDFEVSVLRDISGRVMVEHREVIERY